MTKRRTIFLRHVLVWSLYILYELLLIHISVGLTTSPFHLIIYYLLNISLFYLNAHVILDYSFFKTARPYLVASFFIILEIFVFLFLKLQLDSALSGKYNSILTLNRFNEKLWLANIFREVFFIGFSIAYWSMRYMVRFKERNHVMEKEQLKTIARTLELENKYMSVENAYLQNQISPHLLFNSLNFIYTTVRGQSENAGQGIARLSHLMRYSLVTADDSRTVLLSEEVAQLENLVELCRMRFGDEFYLGFRKRGKLSGIRIIPLILITLVENMMKHGDLGEKGEPARISLAVKDGSLLFETQNKKRNIGLYPKGGLGLKNIQKRLNNYYHERYTLLIRDVENLFIVTLTIKDL